MAEAVQRIDRGMHHLHTLRRHSVRFLKQPDHGVVHDFDSEPGYLLVKAFAHRDPPPLFNLLIGEALYEFRAALNGLACKLVEANNKTPNAKTEFPVFAEETKFSPKRRDLIGKMSRAHQAIIEREQPFNAYPNEPTNDPLWWLYLLSNHDRHQALHVTTATSRGHVLVVKPPEVRPWIVLESQTLGPLKGEAEVARYRLVNPREVDVEVDSGVELDIAFDAQSPIGARRIWLTFGDIGIRLGELLQKF
jgi:hypothetical protein